jgi:tetratricopeptide (TPR) repeat protein
MKKLTFLVLALILITAAGCAGNKKRPTQKEAATKQWNNARATVLAQLAKSQYEAGSFDKSQQTLNEAMTLAPENPGVHLLQAKLSIEQGQLDRADRELKTVLKLDPKSAEAEYLSGVVYQRWQKPDLALECYVRASEKAPEELAYVLARAEMLVAINNSNDALTLLRGKLDFFEHNAVIHHAIGQILMDQGKYPQAVEALGQAAILAPDDAKVRDSLAMAQFQNRQYREASVIYARMLKDEANAQRLDVWLALGECQMQIGRTRDARGSFEKATEVGASSPAAWLSLAKCSIQLGDTRRAELVLRKALALDAGSAEAHLMMGYVRLRQDKLNEAMGEFQKASALDSTDTVSLCMQGYVLEKTGKPEAALKCYAQALKIKPDDELAAKLIASVDLAN